MGKEGELSDFGCWCQGAIMGCSHKTISRVYGERYPDIQRMGRLVQMIERGHEVTTGYNQGMQNSSCESTTRPTLMKTGYTSIKLSAK